MTTDLVTFPASFLGEALGVKPDYRRNPDMANAITLRSALIFSPRGSRTVRALSGGGGAK